MKATKRSKGRFVDEDSRKRYYQHLQNSRLAMERSFKMDGVEMLRHQAMMRYRGWQKFCLFSTPACLELVREFYSNLPSSENDKVWVRGVLVPFGQKEINKFYELMEVNDDMFLDEIGDEKFRQMGESLCPFRAKWHDTRGIPQHFKKESMDPIPKIWVYFFLSRVIPTQNLNEINREKGQLLYGFQQRWVMNMGRMIYTILLDYTMRVPKGRLPFPQLITALCKQAGVEFDPNEEETVDLPAPIGNNTVKKICRDHEAMMEKMQEEKDPAPLNFDDRLKRFEDSVNKKLEDMKNYQVRMCEFWAEHNGIYPTDLPQFGEEPSNDEEEGEEYLEEDEDESD